MYRYQILIEYVGTPFIGWQIQKKGKSVQKLVQSTISKILKEKIKIIGAGRTDKNVHSRGQSAHFDTKKKIINTKTFSANYFALIYKKNKKKISHYLNIYINQISYLLREMGVNINTVPVLDVRRKNTNKIIGDRSFSQNPKIWKKISNL